MSINTPVNQFSRIAGRYNSLAPFYIMSGKQQVVTEGINNAINNIDMNCYHTKMYTTLNPITLFMGDGFQDGQLKKLSFSFKGNEDFIITVECPALTDTCSHIIFSQIGDYIILMWTGGSWIVLESGNALDPTSPTPMVE